MNDMPDNASRVTEDPDELLRVIALTPRMLGRGPLHSAVTASDAAPGERTFRIQELIAVRESDLYDYALLDSMIRQIVDRLLPQEPSLERVLAYGADVMRPGADGDAARQALGAVPLYPLGPRTAVREGGRRVKRPIAWAFTHGGFRFVYGLVSAGKPTSVGGTDNDWISTLCNELRACRPRVLRTGPFSRLVRNKDLAGPLRSMMVSLGTELTCAEHPVGFSVTDVSGSMIWDLLVNAAHADWTTTLTRLQMGTVYDLKQGRLPRGGDHPLPGIKQAPTGSGRKRVLVADLTQLGQVRAIIETAASGMSEVEAADVMANAGVRARRQVAKGQQAPLINEVGNVVSAVKRLWQHLPTYWDGTYVYHQRNTLPGLKEMAGMPVYRTHAEELGEFRFILKFPVPDGGWHDPELIRQAIARRLGSSAKKSGHAARGMDEKPLAGLSRYVAGEHEYRLLCDGRSYILRRRPAADSGSGRTAAAFGLYEGELVGRFAAASLHKTVAGILRTISLGTPTSVPCAGTVDEQDIDELQGRADSETQTAARMREIAAKVADPEESDRYQRQASEHQLAARALRQRILDARSTLGVTASAVAVDLSQALALAEILERTSGETSRRVRNVAHALISRMAFEAAPGSPLAQVSIWVNLRTATGHIKVGPLSAPVINTTRVRRAAGTTISDRQVGLIRALLGDDADLTRTMEGLTQRDECRRVLAGLRELLPDRRAAGMIMDCPIPAVQRIALNPAFRRRGLDPLAIPEGMDPAWIHEIEATYGEPFRAWSGVNWARGNQNQHREVVTWVARYAGDDGVTVQDLQARLGVTDLILYAMLNDDPAKYDRFPWTVPPLERTMDWPARRPMDPADRRVRVPWCGTCNARAVPHMLSVPELPEGWLCATCRTAPGSTTVYPEDYLRPWVGGLQGGQRIRGENTRQSEWVGTYEHPPHVLPRAGR
jgi:hypothetical protein